MNLEFDKIKEIEGQMRIVVRTTKIKEQLEVEENEMKRVGRHALNSNFVSKKEFEANLKRIEKLIKAHIMNDVFGNEWDVICDVKFDYHYDDTFLNRLKNG